MGKKKQNKTKPCFTGGWSFQVGSVRWAYLFFFLFLVAKMTLKHKNFEKIRHFLQKNLGKIFWLIFQKFSAKIFKIKKKFSQNRKGKFGLVAKVFFFFFFFFFFCGLLGQYLISLPTFSAPCEFGNFDGMNVHSFRGTKKVGCEIRYCPLWIIYH